jgi:hypothetical protein
MPMVKEGVGLALCGTSVSLTVTAHTSVVGLSEHRGPWSSLGVLARTL